MVSTCVLLIVNVGVITSRTSKHWFAGDHWGSNWTEGVVVTALAEPKELEIFRHKIEYNRNALQEVLPAVMMEASTQQLRSESTSAQIQLDLKFRTNSASTRSSILVSPRH